MVYFLSDLHLGASYIGDEKSLEKALTSLLRSIKADATHLFLLGDIIDYWFEYKDVVPRGFVRFLGALAELADSGVKIVWLKGNHDIWMTDYLTGEIGCQIVDGILDTDILGKRFVMEHGDGIGRPPLTFRLLRRLFRSSFARRIFAAVHPRLTVGFAHAWSSHSRKAGGYNRPDVTPVIEWATSYLHSHGNVDYFVFGHYHMAFQTSLSPGCLLTMLGDGFRSHCYAAFDGSSLQLLTFSPES